MNYFKSNYDNLISYTENQNINSYINFIVEQLFNANKYFNDQEPWKKKNDTKRLNTSTNFHRLYFLIYGLKLTFLFLNILSTTLF